MMYFRLRYVLDMSLGLGEGEVLNFPYAGNCPTVRVFDQLVEGRKALICEGVCEREVEKPVQEAFELTTTGVALDSKTRDLFTEVLSNIFDRMEQTIRVLRWRCSVVEGPIRPFRDGKEAYSFDGAEWRETPRRAVSCRLSFGHPQKSKISESNCKEIVSLVERGTTESFERTMFIEAWNLREGYPKAALVIGVAAVEIGFRRLIGTVGGRRSISKLLEEYWPHPSPIPVVHNLRVEPLPILRTSLELAIEKRNAVVHNGAEAPGRDELREILWNISQLLWIWDFYSGQSWALEHVLSNLVSVSHVV